MFWRSFGFRDGFSPGDVVRRAHERWLDRALRSGKPYPRIPLRRADHGGFDRMRARAGGRDRAARWWALALERVTTDPSRD
ncbi:MAG: hypothetical protein ACKVU4_09975 [Phycisphaerales bacterium]